MINELVQDKHLLLLTMEENIKAAIRNILIIVLTLGMCGTGMIKLVGLPEVIVLFDEWSFPYWSRIAIGFIELVIGICIFIPQTRKYALGVLLVEMLVAASIHIYFEEYYDVRGPLGVIVGAGLLLFLSLPNGQKSK
jgi:uncharacterized membrane protein YphA (DoxX/SURF4 family)